MANTPNPQAVIVFLAAVQCWNIERAAKAIVQIGVDVERQRLETALSHLWNLRGSNRKHKEE